MSIKIKFFEITAPFYEKIHFSGKEKIVQLTEKERFFEKSDRVLDLAGGTGRISQLFVKKVQEIIVADASEKMLAQCRKKQGLKCEFALAEKLPFPDQSFEKIIVIDAFHHFQDQAKVILEMRRVLNNNGKIFLEEINPRSFGGLLLKIAEKILLMGSKFHSTKKLKGLFEKSGFKVEIVDRPHSFYNLIVTK
ncbi:class I SAM-dependent methyltransferase [Candidatus Kuenenbacteria bacterium]|nr:class I SAM-dependent methyltransferase [Candidatus Kuenenbacteria bacterium]